MRVRWAELDRRVYDQMVSVAISRLHPGVERIDGAGGDDGRDVQIRDGDTLTVFQLKSFTGRVGESQRQQIKRSLQRVAKLDPDAWFLVVPIDHTPGELKWFDGLRADYAFPLTWHGLTWLEDKFAAMPDIVRYYCSSARDEVFDLLRQLREEQAAVSDARDALERTRRLHQRLDEIDPHFTYSLVTGPTALTSSPQGSIFSYRMSSETRVDVYERYSGALKDRPILGSCQIRLDLADPELKEQIEEAIGFGGNVTVPAPVLEGFEIDAPGGLGGSFVGGELELGGQEAALDPPLELISEVLEGDRVIVSLPFVFTHRRGGQQGAVWRGRDQAGCLDAILRVSLDGHASFTYTLRLSGKTLLPSAIRTVGNWLVAHRAPRVQRLRVPVADSMTLEEVIATPLVHERAFWIVDALDDIQRNAGVFFPMPLDLSDHEVTWILHAAQLLSGQRVRVPWTSQVVKMTPVGAFPEALVSPEGGQFHFQGQEHLEIRGYRIPLGFVVTQLTGRVHESDELRAGWTAGREVEVTLEPAGDGHAVRWLRPPAAGEEDFRPIGSVLN